MKQLFCIDLNDHDGCTEVFRRPSARAVIFKKGKIALVYAGNEHYYKFPGGGIRDGEDMREALIREVREEVGLTVLPESIREFGSVMRRQKSDHRENTIFEQENFYFFCETKNDITDQELDDYEREAGFMLRYVDIGEAIEANRSFHSDDLFDEIMIKRDMRVMELIRDTIYAGI